MLFCAVGKMKFIFSCCAILHVAKDRNHVIVVGWWRLNSFLKNLLKSISLEIRWNENSENGRNKRWQFVACDCAFYDVEHQINRRNRNLSMSNLHLLCFFFVVIVLDSPVFAVFGLFFCTFVWIWFQVLYVGLPVFLSIACLSRCVETMKIYRML